MTATTTVRECRVRGAEKKTNLKRKDKQNNEELSLFMLAIYIKNNDTNTQYFYVYL